MKLVTCLALIVAAQAILAPAEPSLSPPRTLEGEEIDVASELAKIKDLVLESVKSWGWTAEVIEDKKIEVSHTKDEKTLAIFDLKIEKIALNNEAQTEYIIFSNIPASSEDTRFERFRTAHLFYRRKYNTALQKEFKPYLLAVLTNFKKAHDFYSVEFTSNTLGEKLTNLMKSHFDSKLTEEIVFSEPNFFWAKYTTTSDPKIELKLYVIPVQLGYFKIEIFNGKNSWATYVQNVMMKNFDDRLFRLVSDVVAKAIPQTVEINTFIDAVKKKAYSLCGGSEFPIEVIPTESAVAALVNFNPPDDLKCAFTESKLIVTMQEIFNSRFVDIDFDGPHLEAEYLIPLSLNTLEGSVNSRMQDIFRTDRIIVSSLEKSKTETELTVFNIDEWLKKILGEEPEIYELDAESKKQYEGEGGTVARAYRCPKSQFDIILVKTDTEYLLIVNSPVRHSFTRIQLQQINGYNQFELMQSQFKEILGN